MKMSGTIFDLRTFMNSIPIRLANPITASYS
jgi:hypothetical protein